MMGIWCDGQKWRARPDGYKNKGGEVIIAKGKRKRMDRDDEGALHQLDHVVRDALMSVLFEKRAHYRSQYDGDEKRQQKGRNERRSRQAKKGKAKLENSLMEQAQYRVLERVSSKEGPVALACQSRYENGGMLMKEYANLSKTLRIHLEQCAGKIDRVMLGEILPVLR